MIRTPGRFITVGEACQKLNPHLFKTLDPEAKVLLTNEPMEKPKKKRIKQKSTDGMNKLEREALALLRSEYPQSKIEPHTMKLQLANGCWFYPDFTVFHGCPPIALYEIKGPHFWEDAIVKLKVAARQWPGFSWWLMWKEKGQWQRQRILP